METSLITKSLDMALADRRPAQGQIHPEKRSWIGNFAIFPPEQLQPDLTGLRIRSV